MNGAIVVDKPAGWTSHDVVNKVRRLLGTKKVGHLGTLDPIATGVLPLLVARATRLAQFFNRGTKRYEGTVRFGVATDTWDSAGQPVGSAVEVTLNCAEIDSVADRFRGPFKQVPPPVSAKKVGGVPAYKLARQNKPVDLPACDVEVYELRVTRCEANEVDLEVHCSAGTYMRGIAHEMGQALGCGAHLLRLRRTSSSDFNLSQACTIEQMEVWAAEDRMIEAIVPARELLPTVPVEVVDSTVAAFIRQGRPFRVSPFRPASVTEARYVKAVDEAGELIAIGEIRLPNLYQPIVVL